MAVDLTLSNAARIIIGTMLLHNVNMSLGERRRTKIPFGGDLLFDHRESKADIKANDPESHSKDGLWKDSS